MTIIYRSLDNVQNIETDPTKPAITAYQEARYQYIKTAEEHGNVQLAIYDDGKHLATIGVGINLKDVPANNKAVSQVILGSFYTDARASEINSIIQTNNVSTVQAALDAKMASWATPQNGLRTHYTFNNEAEVKQAFSIIATRYENNLDTKMPFKVADSQERLTLFSLNYNTSAAADLIGPSLKSDFSNGNRAEAWFEVRYNSNGGTDTTVLNGQALRRYYEADRLNLYNDKAHVTANDAKQVAQMYTTHRLGGAKPILDYEKTFDPKVNAGRWTNELHTANTIQDIYHELRPAIQEFVTEYKIHTPIQYEEVQMATSSIVNLNGDTNNPYSAKNNDDDLLIGSDVANTLKGDQGNDALIGLGGRDSLYGGAGNDYLVAGKDGSLLDGGTGNDTFVAGNGGVDTIVGGDGKDTLDLSAQATAISITFDGSSVAYTGTADAISGIEGYIGTKAADTFVIQNNAAILEDTINGGLGNDLFVFKSSYWNASIRLEDSDGDLTIKISNFHSSSGGTGQGSILSIDSLTLLSHNVSAYGESWKFSINYPNPSPYGAWEELEVTQSGNKVGFYHRYTGWETGLGGGYAYAGVTNVGSNFKLEYSGTTFHLTYIPDNSQTDLIENGTAANDTLIPANTVLVASGGGGADTFKLTQTTNDSLTITDFTKTQGDVIDITAFDGQITKLSDMQIQYDAENAYFTLPSSSGGKTIQLSGVALGSIKASHFISNSLDYGTGQTINGAATADTIAGSGANDLIHGNAGADSITGGLGADTLYGDDGNNTIYGGYGNDSILGGVNDDKLYGDSGNDTIFGGAGNDTIDGGLGNNLIFGGAGNDSMSGWYKDTIEGGGGADTIGGGGIASYASSPSAVNINLNYYSAPQSGGDATGDILRSIDGIIGSAYNDTLMSSASYAYENIFGGGGNDYIDGGKGLDTLEGGIGADTIKGGSEPAYTYIAIASYASSSAAVNVNLNLATAQSGGDAAGDILSGIDGLIGSAYNDLLTGNANANTFSSGNGNDTIIGGAGADTIDGGAGIDAASYATSTSAVNVNLTLITAQAGGDAAGDILTNIENIIGSNYNDSLTGNTLANALYGGIGNDILAGGAGADTLTGGLGADKLDGGTGTDMVSYIASATAVNVSLALTTAQSGGDAAGDIISNFEGITGSSYNDTLTGGAGNDSLAGGLGNDSLTGSAGNDTLSASTGNDTLFGGEGNDLLYGGNGSDYVDGGAGTDTLSYATSSTWVSSDLGANNHWNGDAAWDNVINVENLIGSAFSDYLTGNAGNNNIAGGDGNDSLTGGAGNDTLAGGNGGDTLIGGDGNDVLIGNAGSDYIDGGAGSDTISYASSAIWVNVDLGANNHWNGDAAWDNVLNVENIIGSNFNDQLLGNAGANNINGGAGNDLITGNAGADTLTGGAGNDMFIFKAISQSATAAPDIIMDFVHGADHIDLRGLGFTGVVNGGATGATLGYSYDATHDQTILTSASGLKILMVGHLDLTSGDFIYA